MALVALVRIDVSEGIANVSSAPILAILLMEAIGSSETSALTRATRRSIPEDGILHIHRPVYIKSYIHVSSSLCSVIIDGAVVVYEPRQRQNGMESLGWETRDCDV
jgi:hypothetical protein